MENGITNGTKYVRGKIGRIAADGTHPRQALLSKQGGLSDQVLSAADHVPRQGRFDATVHKLKQLAGLPRLRSAVD